MAETKLSEWELKIILRLRQARRAGQNVGFLVPLDRGMKRNAANSVSKKLSGRKDCSA